MHISLSNLQTFHKADKDMSKPASADKAKTATLSEQDCK